MSEVQKKILIVEDDPKICKAYADYLGRLGYSVQMAENGAVGLVRASVFLPDLILLDIVMPVMDGFAMLQEMKSNAALKEIPVIILSNLNSVESVSKAVDIGVMYYLVKVDYGLEALKEKIEEVLVV